MAGAPTNQGMCHTLPLWTAVVEREVLSPLLEVSFRASLLYYLHPRTAHSTQSLGR